MKRLQELIRRFDEGADSLEADAYEQLRSQDRDVRIAALQGYRELNPRSLRQHAGAIAKLLEDSEPLVRSQALETLACVDKSALKQQISPIINALEDLHDGVRQAALKCLQKLDPSMLRSQLKAETMVKLLGDSAESVQVCALKILAEQERWMVKQHAVAIVNLLRSDSGIVRSAVVEIICKHPSVLLNRKVEGSDTPLHLAARDGHLSICQRLVRAGALVNVKNRGRNMPIDLARVNEHSDVVEFLNTRSNPFTIVGGTGDALESALKDERPILRVEWYTIPLPRFYGSIGATHSLLAVMVGDSEECSQTYVIEKAATVRASGESESKQIKNGVHVSHWFDVAPVIGDGPIHCLDHSEIQDGVTLHRLWNIGVELGPYDVGTCNCHHMALQAYNECARETAQVAELPNWYLINIAWFFSPVVTGSGPSAPSSMPSVGPSSLALSVSNPSTSQSLPLSDSSRVPVVERSHPEDGRLPDAWREV
eukprot:TRINITY_DN37563_c0_g1_i1.p1 TRINITY_DN37563_c0_g1~~TRINITY_DN37563_c0_g1_i1.p1  ORF type:complete len:483 (+),score=47.29 TRINITY_DN37563_c0_g1_i1:131-1579(+)